MRHFRRGGLGDGIQTQREQGLIESRVLQRTAYQHHPAPADGRKPITARIGSLVASTVDKKYFPIVNRLDGVGCSLSRLHHTG